MTPTEDEADQLFVATAPIEERMGDLLDQQPDEQPDPESEDDETQRLERVARRLEIEQKVLRGGN
jgi:hypothetical protein